MIIDSHCHAGKGDGLTGPWDTDAPLAKYVQRADRAGIARTNLFAAFHSDYAVANRAVARIVARHPNRFSGFAFVHPLNDRGRVAALVREAVEEFGFVGLKVHRHDGRITREICATAAAYRLPVNYDVMGEVSIVPLLAEEYPQVSFIIPHLGSFADDWAAQVAFIPHLARYPNIHTDTSGVRRFDLLEEALRLAGPLKILFGSDGPWLHPGLELPKEARDLVLAGNFLRLIGRVGRGGPARLEERIGHNGRRGTLADSPTLPRPSDPWVTGAAGSEL